MSDLPQQTTIQQYLADGVETDYVVDYFVPLNSDGEPNIAVYVTLQGATPDPSADQQAWGVDFTYTPNIDPISGGTVSFIVGHVPPNNSVITLSRDVQTSLDVEFSNAQNFNGQNLDDALDKLLLICQQLQTYALQRNLSYKVNSYIPTLGQTILDTLLEGYIWMGTASGGVAAVLLEQSPDVGTLRSELANESLGTDGAGLVGYYDTVVGAPTTVRDFLNGLLPFIQAQIQAQLWQTGDVKDFAGTTIQSGWLACDGSAVSRTTYAALFAVIGTTWGAGDSITTFNVPDFERRATVGVGGSATGTLSNTVGSVGGSETHTQTVNEMPSHDHQPGSVVGVAAGAGGGVSCVQGGAPTSTVGILIQSKGGGTAFTIMQPSAVVTKIIKT